jgi:hypothetical protein
MHAAKTHMSVHPFAQVEKERRHSSGWDWAADLNKLRLTTIYTNDGIHWQADIIVISPR